jgi:glycosyltransferase involved in cell wall biosynthesis
MWLRLMRERANLRVFSVFFHPNTAVTAVGGAEKRFFETSRGFVHEGVSMVVLESSPSLLRSRRVLCKVYTQRSLFSPVSSWLTIYMDWGLWMLFACFRSVRLIQRERCRLIVAPNNTVPNLFPAYFAHLVTRLPLCVVVHHMDVLSESADSSFGVVFGAYRRVGYSFFVSFLKTLAFFIIIRLLKKSDACVAVSGFTARTLVQFGVASNRISVSGNGVDLGFIGRFRALGGEKRYDAVFVGRIVKEKGVFDLLEAWREVRRGRGSARLVVVGSGPDLQEVKETVEEFGLLGNVIVRGRVDDAEMYGLMKSSRVFVFPSRFEGWGLAVAEALACGLPVVCYDIPALREVFGGCESVFLVPLGDVKKLSAAVLKVLELKKNDYDELAEVSRVYAHRFSWQEVALEDLGVIRRLSTADK